MSILSNKTIAQEAFSEMLQKWLVPIRHEKAVIQIILSALDEATQITGDALMADANAQKMNKMKRKHTNE